MKKSVALFALLLAGWAYAQNPISVGDFSKLEVFDRISAVLIPSDKNALEITGHKAEFVRYVNRSGNLRIKMNIENTLDGKDVIVKVYFKSLNSVFSNTGTIITSEGLVQAPSLTLRANQGSEIRLDVKTDVLNVKTNGGGKVVLTGTSASQTVDCNSGGSYEGRELEASVSKVTVRAGGEATIYSTGTVDAKTLAGGNIYVYGGAEVTQKSTAGGKVHIR